jgi:hypothetical protein
MGKQFLAEPLMSYVGRLPRLNAARYEPRGSVEWDGKNLHYFIHEKREFKLPLLRTPFLAAEWFFLQISYVFLILYRMIALPIYFI